MQAISIGEIAFTREEMHFLYQQRIFKIKRNMSLNFSSDDVTKKAMLNFALTPPSSEEIYRAINKLSSAYLSGDLTRGDVGQNNLRALELLKHAIINPDLSDAERDRLHRKIINLLYRHHARHTKAELAFLLTIKEPTAKELYSLYQIFSIGCDGVPRNSANQLTYVIRLANTGESILTYLQAIKLLSMNSDTELYPPELRLELLWAYAQEFCTKSLRQLQKGVTELFDPIVQITKTLEEMAEAAVSCLLLVRDYVELNWFINLFQQYDKFPIFQNRLDYKILSTIFYTREADQILENQVLENQVDDPKILINIERVDKLLENILAASPDELTRVSDLIMDLCYALFSKSTGAHEIDLFGAEKLVHSLLRTELDKECREFAEGVLAEITEKKKFAFKSRASCPSEHVATTAPVHLSPFRRVWLDTEYKASKTCHPKESYWQIKGVYVERKRKKAVP